MLYLFVNITSYYLCYSSALLCHLIVHYLAENLLGQILPFVSIRVLDVGLYVRKMSGRNDKPPQIFSLSLALA